MAANGKRGSGLPPVGAGRDGIDDGIDPVGDGIDEVGVVLGPDEPVGGLFERTGNETTGTATTGTATSRPDNTGVIGDAAPASRRQGATRRAATSGDATSGDATSGDATSGDATSGDATSGDATSGDATSGSGPASDTTSGRLQPPGPATRASPRGASPIGRSTPRRRIALLAWIAADLPAAGKSSNPGASPPGNGVPGSVAPADVALLGRLIVEESLDPLPALDGWLTRPARPEPPGDAGAREATVEAPTAPLPVPPPPAGAEAHLPGVAALVALIVAALIAAYFLP